MCCYFPFSAPEKRQRVPSAYNQFIKYCIVQSLLNFPYLSRGDTLFWMFLFYVQYLLKIKFDLFFNKKYFFCREEIQRIKANNPEISHREAFSTAAKNVSGQEHHCKADHITFAQLQKYIIYFLLWVLIICVSCLTSGHISLIFNLVWCWRPTTKLRWMM